MVCTAYELHNTLRNNYCNITIKWRLGGRLSKMVLGRSADGLFPVILCLITIEKNLIYNLTANQNVIIRHVKVIRTFTPNFSALYAHFGTFSDITLVFVFITSWFTVDL